MIGFFIRRPLFVGMLLVGLCLLGVLSFTELPMELFPQSEEPRIIVNLRSSQTSDPAYLEKHAVIPMESAIATLDKIERLETRIDSKRGVIYVYYAKSANLKYAYLKLQRRAEEVQAAIGTEFSVTVSKSDPEQLSNRFLVLQARGEGSLDQIRAVVDEKVTTALSSIDGVASVEVYGGRSRTVEVLFDENAMKLYGLTVGQVSSKIAEQSGQRLYLGQAEESRRKYFVNLISEYTSLPAIEDLVVKDIGPVLLKNIAEVRDGGAEQETISRINGQEAVTLSLQRSWEANLISLARRTRRAVADLRVEIKPDGIELVIQSDEARTIEDNIQSILGLILIGGILAVGVLWAFLRKPALVLTVSAAVPISVLISMNLFYAFGLTINTLTMVGLAIAVGMLVDSSVVVLESIIRHASMNPDVRQAVVRGTGEVARAITASTLTTVAIFCPFLFSTVAEVRTLGWQVGASIITTLLVSLAVAFLLIPVLAFQFLSRRPPSTWEEGRTGRLHGRMRQVYIVLLKTCFRSPGRTVVATVVLFFLTLGLSLNLSVDVPREVELSEFTVYAILPAGTTIEAADEQVKDMDALLADIPEVKERLAAIEEDNVIFTFRLVEDYEKTSDRSVDLIRQDIIDRLDAAFPRVDFDSEAPQQNTRFMGSSGGGGGAVNLTRLLGVGAAQEKVVVRGRDLEVLRAVADDVSYNIGEMDTVRSARTSVSSQQPTIDLLLDQAALAHFGVSLNTVRSELNGFQRQTSAGIKFKAGADEVDIVLKPAEEIEKKIEDLRRLQFPSSSGGLVPLSQVARIVFSSGYANINRINQEKRVEVTYRFESEIEDSKALLDQARLSVEDLVAGIIPPPGVIIEVAHDVGDASEFTLLIVLAALLIFMILASTFESLLAPGVMMFTIPLAGIGAFTALILTSNSINNANVLIGFLILFGVVVNNGVLLIDYARQLVRRGQRQERALMTSGLTRVRPILITAVTTILGMLPIAMGQGAYVSLIGAPFAITVIGGLAVATLFTLVLIPTVSFSLENALAWWRGLGWKIKAVQGLVFAAGSWLLFASLDTLLWQVAYSLILLLGIPAFTFFAMTSLRRSQATIIPPGTPITLTIRNVSKLYDDFAKFTKEWRKGLAERAPQTVSGAVRRGERRHSLVWKLPLFAFLVYFTYFYLQSGFWIVVFAVVSYLLVLQIPGLSPWKTMGSPKSAKRLPRRVLSSLVAWGLPLANCLWFQSRWRWWGAVAVIAVIWYSALYVYRTSRKIEAEKINVDRITGRLRKPRTVVYRFVRKIPVIGARKVPFQALDRVSLEIGSGMFGLIGPNGSGKTTLMRAICGILPPTRGKVFFNGLDLGRHREELQSLIGYLPQEFGAYQNMTALDFLDYQAQLKGLWSRRKRTAAVEEALRAVHLWDRRLSRIKTFSGGMKQRLGIAQTLLHLPRILVVDEPTAGLDPTERIKFRNLLAELSKDRIVIFSTHIIEDISSSCNRLAVLLKGKVRFVGPPSDMIELTRGSVWQAVLDDSRFEVVRKTFKVLHHMRDKDKIRVRILAGEKPLEDAVEVTPTLEDSYMWLLGREGLSQ